MSCRAKSSLLFARQLTQRKCSLCSQGNYEVKLHVKSASFSADTSRTSRLSIFYRISNHKNFIPKYLDNALKDFAQTIYSVYSSLTHCQKLGLKLGTRWRLRVRTKAIMAANSYQKMYGDKGRFPFTKKTRKFRW